MLSNMNEHKKNAHCSYCGARFAEQTLWPRRCFICYNDSYSNPLPVVVVMLVVEDGFRKGVLIQKRGIEPKKGEWALTGGYMDLGETWQEAAVREVREELNLEIKETEIELCGIESSTKKDNILIFCKYGTWDWNGYDYPGLKDFFAKSSHIPNHEVEEVKVLWEPMELAFPAHTKMVSKFFESCKEKK